jgi:hypothetical protein
MQYKVAIRSYNRSNILKECTLSLLKKYNFEESKIFIFVGDMNQLEEYQKVIKGSYNFVVGKVGIANIDNFITDYFDEGERVICLDDDITGLFEVEKYKDPKSKREIVSIEEYFEYGFNSLDKLGLYCFSINVISNYLFLSNYPFVTIGPQMVPGCCYGIINRKDIRITYNHLDDSQRTALILEKDQSILKFTRATLKVDYGKLSGGLQSSDMRGSNSLDRKNKTLRICEEFKKEEFGKFFKEPKFDDKYNLYHISLNSMSFFKKNYGWKSQKYFEYFENIEEERGIEKQTKRCSLF